MIVPNLHLEKTHTWKNPGKNPKNPKKPGFFGFFQDFGFLPNPALSNLEKYFFDANIQVVESGTEEIFAEMVKKYFFLFNSKCSVKPKKSHFQIMTFLQKFWKSRGSGKSFE